LPKSKDPAERTDQDRLQDKFVRAKLKGKLVNISSEMSASGDRFRRVLQGNRRQ
jgi:hypothetical protein